MPFTRQDSRRWPPKLLSLDTDHHRFSGDATGNEFTVERFFNTDASFHTRPLYRYYEQEPPCFRRTSIAHLEEYLLETMGSGVALLDYDNDGLLDIFLCQWLPRGPAPKGTVPQKTDLILEPSLANRTSDRMY